MNPVPAATLLLIRDGDRGVEVVIAERHQRGTFPGFHVFPGGAVDPGDEDLPIRGDAPEGLATALRETAEEIGLYVTDAGVLPLGPGPVHQVLTETGHRFDGSTPVPLPRWITPEWVPYRFDTAFFVTDTTTRAEIRTQESELVWAGWVPVADALERVAQGSWDIVTPTTFHLRWLGSYPDVSSVMRAAEERRDNPPIIVVGDDVESVPSWMVDGMDDSPGMPLRIRRVLAPNPGPYTGPGTNTWVVESASSAVIIDPGPIDQDHADAIVEELGGLTPTGVLVTHTHEDHAPLANPLARELGVPTLGYRPGPGFDPDVLLENESRVTVGAVDLVVVHTPGHSDDHLCFLAGNVLFTGDHIMGGGSVMIEDLEAYMASLDRIRRLDLRALYPGHGEVMDQPLEVIDWYIAHRQQREEEIKTAIGLGAETLEQIVEVVYASVDPSLYPLAARSVRAHLVKLESEGSIRVTDGPDPKVESAK